MGEVYLAIEAAEEGPRACVVKKVLPHLTAQSQFVSRFLDEARVAVRLRHPNIARVHNMGEVEGEYYLAMEYVQGKTLSRFGTRLRELGEAMPVGLVLLAGELVCAGLSHAHAATDDHGQLLQLVHRDLSPANVCISYDGEVKIIDFGAAHSTLKEAQTAPRVVIGNLAYMAPEQARKKWVDGRADVYSLGAVLWELLAHQPLQQEGDPIERWRKAANPQWQPPSALRADVPPEVDAVVLKALATQPDGRHADAASFGVALGALRARLAPEASEAALGALLRRAFARESAAETAVLERLMASAATTPESAPPVPASPVRLPDARPSRRQRRPSASCPRWTSTSPLASEDLVPPTALAYEHPAVSEPLPDGPVPERLPPPVPTPMHTPRVAVRHPVASSKAPLPPPMPRARPPRAPPRRMTTEVFGAVLEGTGGAEARLVREIEGTADETPSESLEEPTTSQFDTLGERRLTVLSGTVFLAALALGLALVLWLGS